MTVDPAAKNAWLISETFRKAGIPPRYRAASLGDFSQPPEMWPDGIFITGSAGTGKTHLATALLKLALAETLTGRWLTVTEFVYEMKSTFDDDNRTEGGVVRKYANIGILMLDDICTEAKTDYALSVVTVLIARRLNNLKPTIVTSNLKLKEIHQLDPRLASRLGGMKYYEMTGDDRRLPKKGE